VAAVAAIGFAASPAAASTCSQLASSFHRPNTTITTAQTVPAGTFVTPTVPPQSITGLPKFCRLAGFTTPTSDSHINFEVWIPESGWNLKYLQAGCGGFCGSISYNSLAEPLRRGYAVAATDDGHQASGVDASWAAGHPEKVVDFGYRALKETTDVAKALIIAFESSGPRRSYFMGCSDGGREALMEAQRFPRDFDGIVAGSPANNWTKLMTGFLWDERALAATAAGDLSQADLNLLSNAALAQCVGHDGGLSNDKFLNNPRACHFKPETLSCNSTNAASCLTPDKIEAVEKIFSGPPDIFPGYGPGGEANVAADWPVWITGPGNPALSLQGLFANNYFQYIVFPNSGWTPNSFSIEENAHQADVRTKAILSSVDPNLQPFRQQGGKLIQYVGWADSAISPQSDIDYHKAVTDVMGGSKETGEFYRLFMVPGMAHCGGGPGANAFGQGANGPFPSDPADDILSALDHWVELHVAPEKIIATKYVNDDPNQGVAFQRPLCPFPKIAKYKGQGGSTTEASSFECSRSDGDGDHDRDRHGDERAENR
jgi:feruloyl esterase